jgi:hypothetical protein
VATNFGTWCRIRHPQKHARILQTTVHKVRDDFGMTRVSSAVQELLKVGWGITMMSLVRLLGFTTLGCGCVTGHYREVATNREITYVEEKGAACSQHAHRRNHTLTPARAAVYSLSAKAS